MEPRSIHIRGAKTHNLKNLDIDIPRNKLVVITGLSGSGKSSLAVDTLFAEGQRRYIESLSGLARKYSRLLQKPNVDSISSLPPAICVDRKNSYWTSRSTTGSVTEIYDFLRLLFSQAGHRRSPQSGRLLTRHTLQQMIQNILKTADDSTNIKLILLSPVPREQWSDIYGQIKKLVKQGYSRFRINEDIISAQEADGLPVFGTIKQFDIVIDRLVLKDDIRDQDKLRRRLGDSLELALKASGGMVRVLLPDTGRVHNYSSFYFDRDCDRYYPVLSPELFSFNSPDGACPSCNGMGLALDIDPDRLIAPSLPLGDGGILPLSDRESALWKKTFTHLREIFKKEGIDIAGTFQELTTDQQSAIINGLNPPHTGLHTFLTTILNEHINTNEADELKGYLGNTQCPQCKGLRLNAPSLCVSFLGLTIGDFISLPLDVLHKWLKAFLQDKDMNLDSKCYKVIFPDHPILVSSQDKPTSREETIARPIIEEIEKRVSLLLKMGLPYLTLNRSVVTLSCGESQRIRLASQMGHNMSGVLFVLDEPSLGLHPQDLNNLNKLLYELKSNGNSVIIVEHDPLTMAAADYLLELGPGAGVHGGKLLFQGTYPQLLASDTLTAQYLNGRKAINAKELKGIARRLNQGYIIKKPPPPVTLRNIQYRNLQNISIQFPISALTTVTGVSGSGKSTLVHDIIRPLLSRHNFNPGNTPSYLGRIKGADNSALKNHIQHVILMDQSPVGRTPRSNPATYTGIFSHIRTMFAGLTESRVRGYKPARFSFNTKGGRCETCKGEGQVKVDMQLLDNVYVPCEGCQGKRYNPEILDIKYKGLSIFDVLELTIEKAEKFFQHIPPVYSRLKMLMDVGLGYLQLGQSAITLSGGEAQRLKLASELSKRADEPALYLLDEPSSGLHFEDIKALMVVLFTLTLKGNTIILIEHNLDIINASDWVIDMGPAGGDNGGQVVAMGTPAEIALVKSSHTGQWLDKYRKRQS